MTMENFDEDILLSGQESPQDKWLTDEEYASGKWYRFALERLLPMVQSTRLTTSQLEFVARAGWIVYVPRMVWIPRWVNTNPLADDEKAVWPLFQANGDPLLVDGRPLFMQGLDMVPFFLSDKKRNLYQKTIWYGRIRFDNFQRQLRSREKKDGDKEKKNPSRLTKMTNRVLEKGKNLFRQELVRKATAVLVVLIPRFLKWNSEPEKSELVQVRYWIPTPILGETFPQSPRLPFEMVPKWELQQEFDQDWSFRKETIRQVAIRNSLILQGSLVYQIPLPGEFVDYQFCGVPSLDGELIRLFRTERYPRPEKLSPTIRRYLDAGIKLWDFDKKTKKIKVVAWLENEAGVSLRVHRRVAESYITAEQVFTGIERTKVNASESYNPFNSEGVTKALNSAGINVSPRDSSYRAVLRAERRLQAELAVLAKTEPIKAAQVQKELRGYFEEWVEENYDRKLPNEQYAYREWFYDLNSVRGGTWETRANAWWNQMQLRVCLRRRPGIGSSTSQKARFLEMRLLVADFESWRNLEHMQEHWKFSKAIQNTLTAFNPDKNAPQSMRQKDWGGIWNPIRAEFDWRWNLLHQITFGHPARREVLMSLAWVDKEPWQMMDHDGSLIERFGQKKVGWVQGGAGFKELQSRAGTFDFPKSHDGKLAAEKSKFRDYPSEYDLLRNDEYFARDPIDVIKNQKGIAIFSVIDDVNLRLKGRFKAANRRLIAAGEAPILLTYENCFAQASFVQLMAENLPVEPIVKAIEGSMRTWKRKNIMHFRPEIDRMLDGTHINPELRVILEKWYRLSDERIWDMVYYQSEMMASLEDGASGAGGWEIKDSARVCNEGFGTGYGPVQMWQVRQEAIMEVGLFTQYYSVIKGVIEWWDVRVTAVKLMDSKSWPDINDLKLKIAGLLESRKIIYIVAERMLWPKLHVASLLPTNEPFPLRSEDGDGIDNSFVLELLNTRAGVDHIPTPEEIDTIDDPANKALVRHVREEAIGKNMMRFIRVADGRHFEINQ